jgi:hypothetical protein
LSGVLAIQSRNESPENLRSFSGSKESIGGKDLTPGRLGSILRGFPVTERATLTGFWGVGRGTSSGDRARSIAAVV